jgi:hypothetical protein
VSREPTGWDVTSPVQAEIFMIWRSGDHLELTGPCGAAPWIVELGATEHPVEVVDRIVRDVVGDPLLIHSTSWRRDRDAVILSFVVVIDPALVGSMESIPIGRAALARSAATAAPADIATETVVETVCATWPGSPRTIPWSRARSTQDGEACLRPTSPSRSAR